MYIRYFRPMFGCSSPLATYYPWTKICNIVDQSRQEIVFKKDKATLHVISKRCADRVNYFN